MSNKKTVYDAKEYNEAKNMFRELRVKPGWTIFFENKKKNHFDHIAIVMAQDEDHLNLQDALILHSTPPGIGIANGPLSGPQDLSGLRITTVTEYLDHNPKAYSRIAVGYPGGLSSNEVIIKAGAIAQEIGRTGLIDSKPAIFSFPVLGTFFFLAEYDYVNRKIRKLMPTFGLRKKISKDIAAVYCGDLIGRIYETAGARNLPKVSVLGIKGYKSTCFYEWQRDHNTLMHVVTWSQN